MWSTSNTYMKPLYCLECADQRQTVRIIVSFLFAFTIYLLVSSADNFCNKMSNYEYFTLWWYFSKKLIVKKSADDKKAWQIIQHAKSYQFLSNICSNYCERLEKMELCILDQIFVTEESNSYLTLNILLLGTVMVCSLPEVTFRSNSPNTIS